MVRAWSWVLCFMVWVESIVGFQFSVRGSKGWGLPSPSDNETYNQWAGRNRFQIGDTLLFKYDNTVDSVAQVRQESYKNCNTTAPIVSYTTGNTVFTFLTNGPFFFISGNESRCQLGERLIVVVLAPCHVGKGKNCKRALAPSPSHTPISPALPSSPSSLASPAPSPNPMGSSPSPSPPPSPMASPASSPSPLGSPASSPSPLGSPASSPSPLSSPASSTSPLSNPASSPSPLASPASSPSPLASPASSPSPLSSPASSPSPLGSPDSSPSPTDSSPLPSSASPPTSPTPPESPPPNSGEESSNGPSPLHSPTPSAASTTLPLSSLLIPLLFATLINARIVTI